MSRPTASRQASGVRSPVPRGVPGQLPALALSLVLSLVLAGCTLPQHRVLLPPPDPAPPARQAPAGPAPSGVAPRPAPDAMPAIPSAVPPPAGSAATTVPPPPPPPPSAPPAAMQDRAGLLKAWIADQRRLYRVAAPLLLSNTGLCPQFSRRILGFTAKNAFSYSSEFVAAAQEGLGLDDRLRIANVLPGGGAELAGLQRDDLLVSAGERALPRGADAERAAASVLADASEGSQSVELTVQRDDEQVTATVRLTPACAMIIDLGNTAAVNSYADGRRLLLTRGMLGFVQSDTELAYVLAREMASNIVSPAPRPAAAAIVDRLHALTVQPLAPDDATTVLPWNAESDAATERLGLYLLARAGYGLDGVAAFWQRLAADYPAGTPGTHAAAHAPIADRLAEIERVLPVLRGKLASGAPLQP